MNEKCLTDSREHAAQWWNLFESREWFGTDDGGAIFEVEVAAETVEQFEFLGENHDGIGPAWAAEPAALEEADVEIIREWSANEDPT